METTLIVFAWITGYSFVGGFGFSLAVWMGGNPEYPGPTFAGIFWPVAVPMLAGIALAKRLTQPRAPKAKHKPETF